MGFEQKEFNLGKIVWRVSRHNSRNDKIDDLLSEQLKEELHKKLEEFYKLIEEPDYKRLEVFHV